MTKEMNVPMRAKSESETDTVSMSVTRRSTASSKRMDDLELNSNGLDGSDDAIIEESSTMRHLLGDGDDDDDDNDTTTKDLRRSNERGTPLWCPDRVEQILFSPQDDREIQIFRKENIAVPACYLAVGLGQGLLYPLMNVYPIDLGATEAQQTTLFSIRTLPSCFKIFFGFASDNFPLFGYRRKSYMLLGWTLAILCMLIVALTSDLTLQRLTETADDGTKKTVTTAPSNAPSVTLLGTTFFMWSMGVWFADVMADSLVAEKCRRESSKNKGNLQTTCYLCRGVGFVIATPFSSLAYSIIGPWIIIYSAILMPLFMFPLIRVLAERRMDKPDMTTTEQFQEIWRTVSNRAVWQPMGFIYFYMLFMVPNAAWREYLKSVLGFTAGQLNMMLIIAVLLMFAGVVAFKFVFIKWSWRTVFWLGCCINAFFSALQILLIKGQTFGLSPFFFALGDDAVKDFIAGTQFLPITIMMVNLCPSGVEGASYALFTTVCNAASALNDAISTLLLRIWDVRKDTMVSGDLSGLTKLCLLTTAIQMLPLTFMSLMPKSLEELKKLRDGAYRGSRLGGSIFVLITGFSVLYALFVGFMNVFVPGWSGES